MSSLIKSFRTNDDGHFKFKPLLSALQRMGSTDESTSGSKEEMQIMQADPVGHPQREGLLIMARNQAAIEKEWLLQIAKGEAGAIIAQAKAEAKDEINAGRQRAAELEAQLRAKAESEAAQNARHAILAQAAENLEQMNSLLESARQERVAMLDGANELIVTIALAAAGKLLQKKLEEDRSLTIMIVEKLIERAKSGKELKIRCSPLDVYVLHERSDQLSRMAGGKNILIESDSSIELGGIIIESEFGILDGSLQSQMKELAMKLQEEFSHAE